MSWPSLECAKNEQCASGIAFWNGDGVLEKKPRPVQMALFAWWAGFADTG